MSNRTGGAGCVASLVLIVVLLFLGAILNGCGRPQDVEPALVPPVTAPDSGQPVVSGAIAPAALPTAAPTLPPPPTVTPLPTVMPPPTGDPAVAATTGSILATQTAAAAPPTPNVITTPLAEPLPTPFGVYSWTLKVPILMYHYISVPPPDADIYRVDLSVTPDMFRQQMTWLRDNGYTTIDLYDLTLAIVSQQELPAKPVLLTFDDGYIDNYQNAFPILQEFGFKGTFFIVTEFIDKGREGYMTWPMIEEMARAGQRLESHSRTHPDLRGKSHDALLWEILGSQETLAAHIGYTPRYFCYPGGDYDAATIQMLRDLDFWGAVTTENGSWHGFNDRYEWRRVRMQYETTMAGFARLVDLEGTVSGKPPG